MSQSLESAAIPAGAGLLTGRRAAARPSPLVLTLGLLLVVTAVLDFGPLIDLDNTVAAILTVLLGVAFVIIHGNAVLGWRNLVAFLLITIAISFAAEAIGVATGWVFGSYYYTDLLGPKILGVPPLIQGAYVAMGYASLMIARLLLGATRISGRASILGVALIGAFIMVAWDVAMDPYQSTVGGYWIWRNGGPYFGIGIHNYVGWFATVFLFMLVYQLFASRYAESAKQRYVNSRLFWSLPAIYYGLVGLGMVLVPLVGGVDLPYASPGNYAGTVAALSGSLAIIAFFVMGTPVALALARLFMPAPAAADPAP